MNKITLATVVGGDRTDILLKTNGGKQIIRLPKIRFVIGGAGTHSLCRADDVRYGDAVEIVDLKREGKVGPFTIALTRSFVPLMSRTETSYMDVSNIVRDAQESVSLRKMWAAYDLLLAADRKGRRINLGVDLKTYRIIMSESATARVYGFMKGQRSVGDLVVSEDQVDSFLIKGAMKDGATIITCDKMREWRSDYPNADWGKMLQPWRIKDDKIEVPGLGLSSPIDPLFD